MLWILLVAGQALVALLWLGHGAWQLPLATRAMVAGVGLGSGALWMLPGLWQPCPAGPMSLAQLLCLLGHCGPLASDGFRAVPGQCTPKSPCFATVAPGTPLLPSSSLSLQALSRVVLGPVVLGPVFCDHCPPCSVGGSGHTVWAGGTGWVHSSSCPPAPHPACLGGWGPRHGGWCAAPPGLVPQCHPHRQKQKCLFYFPEG